MIETRGFKLANWQDVAVQKWVEGDTTGPHRGTLEIVTGGGKTLIALVCAATVAALEPTLRLAIVVPTEALARQWQTALERYTTLRGSEIGLLGAGEYTDFTGSRAIVTVLNTAARQLPALAKTAHPLMLIVDECHRAGAPTFAKVLDTAAAYRLGLSATPDREEFDDNGQPLRYDEQRVGQALGSVVYRFSLRDARLAGWLPDYNIHHHGIRLTDGEQRLYDQVSRQVDDLAKELQSLGVDRSRSQQLQRQQNEVGQVARRYIAATSRRKDLLYRASGRSRVAHQILARSMESGQRRVLLFHERVAEAVGLYRHLTQEMPSTSIAIEHSRLSTRVRADALQRFRTGAAQVLVSVKSLVEGIDVPEADVGISVAATSSVRQRIQALGRVLRRRFDEGAPRKHADMHLIYVAETVDEHIYAKEDWADLTGKGANHYWRWPADPSSEAERRHGPPATPRPTEEQEWERLGRQVTPFPVPWHGSVVGQEYSVDTLGTVTNALGTMIRNPQDVAALVERVRQRPGGRFRVTPAHRLILVWGEGPTGTMCYVVGQLREPFQADTVEADPVNTDLQVDMRELAPGAPVGGPVDKLGGTYRLRQKQGGVIERRTTDGTVEFALLAAPDTELAENARRVLDAWRRLFERGISFHLSKDGQAWYTEGSQKRHLAYVPGGFAWPPAES